MFGDLEKNRSVKYIGDLKKRGRRFGETRSAKTLEIWRNVVGDLEKLIWRKRWRFGETWSVIWRNSFGENIGDLEKRGRRSYGDFELEFVME